VIVVPDLLKGIRTDGQLPWRRMEPSPMAGHVGGQQYGPQRCSPHTHSARGIQRSVKVLHVVGGSRYGGGAIVVSSLVLLARRLGWQVDVLTTDPDVQNEVRQYGAGIVDLDVIWREIKPFRDLRGLYRLCRFLRRSDYTLVHTHTSKGGFVGRLAARLAGVELIVHTAHGFAFHEQSSALAVHAYAALERLAAHCCDRIFTVSSFHRTWALRLGIGSQSQVIAIPNGIPPERVVPVRSVEHTRRELGLAPGELAILSIGRLTEQKGLADLVEAIALVTSHTRRAIKYLLAGEGPLKAALQERARRLGLQEQVLFLSLRTDVGDLLAVSDMVVLPSLHEGLSIALLEAMAAGKAVVTTALGSTVEVLQHGETGLLVPTRRPDLLAQAILALAQDHELRARLGTQARQAYEERYTAERMMKQYAVEYLAVCREKGVAP